MSDLERFNAARFAHHTSEIRRVTALSRAIIKHEKKKRFYHRLDEILIDATLFSFLHHMFRHHHGSER